MLHFSAFSLAFFCLAIVVSVFVLSSISYGSFISECFLRCVFSYTFLYPAHLVVLFWLAFLSVFLFLLLVCFLRVVPACGRVISHTIVNKGSFNSEYLLWVLLFFHTPSCTQLFLWLFWLAFPSVSLLLVCFLGVVYMSQPVAG